MGSASARYPNTRAIAFGFLPDGGRASPLATLRSSQTSYVDFDSMSPFPHDRRLF